jgi:parvulin-like peptidyl-prolyl isomerase
MSYFKKKKAFHSALLFVVILISVSVSCSRKSELPEDLVAQVNNEYLLLSDLNYLAPTDIKPELNFALKKNLINKWVNDEVIYQAALSEGLALNDKEKFLIERYTKSFLIQRYLSQKIDRNYRISQKEIDDYYNQHTNEFIHTEDEVHIIHLLLEQRDNAIFREIKSSDNLMEIIKKYYFDEKSTMGRPNGDLGYVPVRILPDEFKQILRRMRTGTISNEIKTDQGYHFIQLVDRQEKGNRKDPELVKNEITLRLKKEFREMELDRLIKDLKSRSQIQTYLSKVQE